MLAWFLEFRLRLCLFFCTDALGFFGGMALDVTGADEIEAEGYESVDGDTYASFGINYLF